MPVITEVSKDAWKRIFRRTLENGPPLSGKTTAMKTWPPKRHLIIAPGELGHSSILPDDDTRMYFWEFDPTASRTDYKKVLVELEIVVREILCGKYGEVVTFGLDGLHKLYYVIMKANGFTIDTDTREYARYHEAFTQLIGPILGSNVPYIVMTCYDGQEAIEAGSKVTQVFPQLPGRMAKEVMGLFPVVLHTKRVGDGQKQQFLWELKASGKMQGAGMHLPVEIAAKFPAEMDQDWRQVEAIINSI